MRSGPRVGNRHEVIGLSGSMKATVGGNLTRIFIGLENFC